MIASDPVALAQRVAAAIGAAGRPLVALDHDGTLSPIALRPQDASLAPGAAEALRRLIDVADVAILSGRGLDDLAARFSDLPLTLVSEHGLRCRDRDGTVRALATELAPATLARLRTDLRVLLAGRTGWHVEDKGVALAVHHRLVAPDQLQPTLGQVHALLEAAAAQPAAGAATGADEVRTPGGHVQPGSAVLELRPAGANKGAALRWLAGRSEGRPVVMVGDDLTDEPALAVAEELGGLGVVVDHTARATAASARLNDLDEVVRFLARLADLLDAPRSA
jgi:trehalose-phosphatase